MTYAMQLRQRLKYEAREAKRGGVYEYTQKQFAFNSISRAGGRLSAANVSRIYDTGHFWADNPGEIFVAKDIIETEGCFNALKFCIDNMDELITPEHVTEIHSRLYPGTPLHMERQLRRLIIEYAREPEAGNPTLWQEITDFHIRFIQYGGDSRTASLISYMQCINNFTTPFIIHPENQALYEEYMRLDANKFCHLLHVEQQRYREETESLL